MKHRKIIDQMNLEDKISLCSGADFFGTKAFEKYGIPAITMTDGPHGIRKQIKAADHLGINESLPATCFPPACLSACSWDRDLLKEMGAAIGEEARQEGISMILGPSVNVKRNPSGGRNFEYFSEDPYLAGELAASWILGIQSTGTAACLKHFAGNNQESERMSSDSLIDERTLREIYLPAFEKTVKKASPSAVMCAYNKLNGIFCSDNAYLLRQILRDEWGFHGVILTDWGAMHDRVKAFEAGLDLEMPSSQGYFDEMVLEAIRNGNLSEKRVDESVDRLLDMLLTQSYRRKADEHYDAEDHHLLAKIVAAKSAVLLKNEEHILPVTKDRKIALIGALAREPRYQGAGSSHITPTQLSSAVDGFDALRLDYTYYPGYNHSDVPEDKLLQQAVAGAQASDIAILFAGLPEAYESEGFDRASLAMPESHQELITRVAEANPNTVVVLVGGAPVEMPWLPKVKAVLNISLAGQAGGLAAAELLTGIVNPSGKLAESYPLCYADVPSAGFYETGGKQAQYREGIYVGYRYYDKARKDVLFPFGYGLSYTTFEYENLVLSDAKLQEPYQLHISATIRNTGDIDGAEIVQVYISPSQPATSRPKKELKEFTKIFLKAGEARQVDFTLDARAFAVYDVDEKDWVVPSGTYQVLIGASSRDIRLRAPVDVQGVPIQTDVQEIPGWYQDLKGQVAQEDFEKLLGRRIEPPRPCRKGEYTLDCSFQDMKDSFIIRQVVRGIENSIGKRYGGVDYSNPTFRMIMASSTGTPLKNLSQLSPEDMPKHTVTGLVDLANGKYLKGIMALVKKGKS